MDQVRYQVRLMEAFPGEPVAGLQDESLTVVKASHGPEAPSDENMLGLWDVHLEDKKAVKVSSPE